MPGSVPVEQETEGRVGCAPGCQNWKLGGKETVGNQPQNMQPQAKERLQPPEAGRARKPPSLEHPEGVWPAGVLTLDI